MAIEQFTPSGMEIDGLTRPQVPVYNGRDFFVESSPGYDSLVQPVNFDNPDFHHISAAPKAEYELYIRMHKVLVGKRGADQLEAIYLGLRGETLPDYLTAAGWAAAEAALVRTDHSPEDRLQLLHKGIECWQRAVEAQRYVNTVIPEHLPERAIEQAAPYRTALDIAISPLLEGMIRGDVSRATAEKVFADCLRIAQLNAIQINLMAREGNVQAIGEHVGFGYECNALLAFNRRFSETWFVIPSMIRSDNGNHHPQQTHDLLVMHQKWGNLKTVIPVEIKAVASARDRRRYKALLIRGKMHLSMPDRCKPEATLKAIEACYACQATDEETQIADNASHRFESMVRDYYAGKKLGELATSRSRTEFHDNARVVANHPGLSVQLKSA